MPSVKIRELPEEDRPREKLLKHGADGLSTSELIAILLRTGVPGKNAVEIGREILAKFKTLTALSRIAAQELAEIPGIGPAKAVQLAAAFKLADRMMKEKVSRQKMDSPELVNEFFGAEMRALTKESLRILLLDTRYHLLDTKEIAVGSLNESIAHPREIFRPAIAHAAYAIILVHNHPSGNPAASPADYALTRRVAAAGELLQIKLLDHVIIGAPSEEHATYFSFKEAGVL
jgi:DNA repair protein RadC